MAGIEPDRLRDAGLRFVELPKARQNVGPLDQHGRRFRTQRQTPAIALVSFINQFGRQQGIAKRNPGIKQLRGDRHGLACGHHGLLDVSGGQQGVAQAHEGYRELRIKPARLLVGLTRRFVLRQAHMGIAQVAEKGRRLAIDRDRLLYQGDRL